MPGPSSTDNGLPVRKTGSPTVTPPINETNQVINFAHCT